METGSIGLFLCCVFLALHLAASVPGAPTLAVPECRTTTRLFLEPGPNNSSQAFVNSTLAPGCQQILYLSGDSCDSSSFLTFELWDLDLEGMSTSEAMADPNRAQPFLVVARGQAPQVFYNASSSMWSFGPANSLSDAVGQSILRPYLQVQTSFSTLMGPQSGPPLAGCPAENPCWFATVLNSHYGVLHPLRYEFRASCSAVPSCPEPELDVGPCSGNGECKISVAQSFSSADCSCKPGWGDVGCNEPLVQLVPGLAVNNTGLQPGQWRYYAFNVPQQDMTLIVELERKRGDPILFVKGFTEGFEPGALPSILDYSLFADRTSWRERSDRAQIIRTGVPAGSYYIGVLNNDDDIQEIATFSLRVRYAPPGQSLCPWACNNNGTCSSTGVCNCAAGVGGKYCSGTLDVLFFGQGKSGALRPGSWAYYSLDLTSSQARKDPLELDFSNDGGQGIVIASFGTYPTLLTANFTFRTAQLVGPLTQVVQPKDLSPAILFIGVYNMDYYVHSGFNYALSVTQTTTSGTPYTSWISVVIALGSSAIVASSIYAIHRALVRRRAGARGWAMLSLWRPLPTLPVVAQERRRPQRRGLNPAIVQSFPVYTFDSSLLEREEGQTPSTAKTNEEEQVCSVCLFGYEDGDLVRQLPCGHDFHCDCIDQWLRKKSTCPMCRVSLVPEGYADIIERESVGGGAPVGDEDVAAAPSPAGTMEEERRHRGPLPIPDEHREQRRRAARDRRLEEGCPVDEQLGEAGIASTAEGSARAAGPGTESGDDSPGREGRGVAGRSHLSSRVSPRDTPCADIELPACRQAERPGQT